MIDAWEEGRARMVDAMIHAGYDSEGEWRSPDHTHCFDSAIHLAERPSALGCWCGALLVRDEVTELWEVA